MSQEFVFSYKFRQGIRAELKALTLLASSVFVALFLRGFWENPRKFGNIGSTEQNATDEPEAIKERGDTEL